MSNPNLSPRQFFHGTRHEFKPGDVLGGEHRANQGAGQPTGRVFMSGRKDVASYFAEASYGPTHALNARPRVYQVESLEQHHPDPDEAPEFKSFHTGRARVVREVPYKYPEWT